MKIRLKPSTQKIPESSATNVNFTRTNSKQLLADTNRDVMQTMDLLHFLDWKKSHVLCKCNSVGVRKVVKDGSSKALIRALPYGTVWVDEPSPYSYSFWGGEVFLSECDLKRKGKRGHFNSVGGGGGLRGF